MKLVRILLPLLLLLLLPTASASSTFVEGPLFTERSLFGSVAPSFLGFTTIIDAQVAGNTVSNGLKLDNEPIPCFVDLDGDGDQDLVIGLLNGKLDYYQNQGVTLPRSLASDTLSSRPYLPYTLASRPYLPYSCSFFRDTHERELRPSDRRQQPVRGSH